jgi:hypothetical protein
MGDSNEPPREINLPQPMTKEVRDHIKPRETYVESGFLYGDNWYMTAAWYKHHYPGFSDEACYAMELFSRGIRAKEYKQMLKKDKRRQLRPCSA